MLTLPDGARLSLDDVVATVSSYQRDYPAVFPLFDLPGGGPHDQMNEIDILSLNAMNAFGPRPAMTPMSEAWAHRYEISRAVAPVTCEPLEDIPEVGLPAEAEKVSAAIEVIDRLHGFGSTASSKLFHRLRPNVGPIWDVRIEGWYGNSGGWMPWLLRVYEHVRDPNTQECLEAARRRLGLPLSLLRVWDVLLWQFGGSR